MSLAPASATTFACGHPRASGNIYADGSCRQCERARAKRRWDDQDPADRKFDYQVRHLPGQLNRALQRVQRLAAAHRDIGMPLELEAQERLRELYGEIDPGAKAEAEYQKAKRG